MEAAVPAEVLESAFEGGAYFGTVVQVALPEEQVWGQWWQQLPLPAVAVIPNLGVCGEVLGFG